MTDLDHARSGLLSLLAWRARPPAFDPEATLNAVKAWAVVVGDPEAIVQALRPFKRSHELVIAEARAGNFAMGMPNAIGVVYGADPPPFAPGEMLVNYAEGFLMFGRRLLVVATPEQAPRVRERLALHCPADAQLTPYQFPSMDEI